MTRVGWEERCCDRGGEEKTHEQQGEDLLYDTHEAPNSEPSCPAREAPGNTAGREERGQVGRKGDVGDGILRPPIISRCNMVFNIRVRADLRPSPPLSQRRPAIRCSTR